MKRELMVCFGCGYIYYPELGDSEGNIPENTPFENLPDTWLCPICGYPITSFDPQLVGTNN